MPKAPRFDFSGAPAPVVLGLLVALSGSGCGNIAIQGSSPQCMTGFNVQNGGSQVALTDNVSELAQSFTVPSAGYPASAQLQLKAAGSPTGNLILKIEGDNGGAPNQVPVATGTLDAAQVRGDAALYRFSFATAPSLGASTVYWLRLKGTNLSNANSLQWISNDSNAFPDGGASASGNGTTWSNGLLGAGRDFLFLIGC